MRRARIGHTNQHKSLVLLAWRVSSVSFAMHAFRHSLLFFATRSRMKIWYWGSNYQLLWRRYAFNVSFVINLFDHGKNLGDICFQFLFPSAGPQILQETSKPTIQGVTHYTGPVMWMSPYACAQPYHQGRYQETKDSYFGLLGLISMA